MYYKYFQFKIAPFSLAPNPRIFYKSPGHRAALAHLLYGFDTSGGFVALTGEVGTGKTTLCRHLVGQVPDNVDVALIVNPKMGFIDLLSNILDELRIEIPENGRNLNDLIKTLKQHLFQSGENDRQTVVIIDEAQNLDVEALEQLRLLSNIETDYEKLLKIILVGQPELTDLLARKDLRQLQQRITARYNLTPLSRSETKEYIHHRVKRCGGDTKIFPDFVIRRIHRYSGGIPRLINALCDRALMGCYASDIKQVDKLTIDAAAREVLPARALGRWPKPAMALAAGLASISLMGAAYYLIATPPSDKTRIAVSSVDKPENDAVAPIVVNSPGNGRTEVIQVLEEKQQPAPVNILPVTLETELEPIQVRNADFLPNNNVIQINNVDAQVSSLNLNLPSAVRQLAQEWQLTHLVEYDICTTAKLNDLRCLAETSDWEELGKLNRPAILKLLPVDGKPRYITLVGLTGRSAIIKLLDDQKYAVPIKQLMLLWKGWYALLWKPPFPDNGLIKPGTYSSSVRWLRERLGVSDLDSKQEENPDYYSYSLRTRVAAYQKSHGLMPDGVVGLRTVISLNDTSNKQNIPRLNKLGFDGA